MPMYMGWRLNRKGPRVTRAVGFFDGLTVVLALAQRFRAQIPALSPSRMGTTPPYR